MPDNKNGFYNVENMGNIMGKITEIKEQLTLLQKELENNEIESTDDSNIVTAVVSGTGQTKNFKFNFDIIETINHQDLVRSLVEAANKAQTKAKNIEKQRKEKIIANINIPDIPGLF